MRHLPFFHARQTRKTTTRTLNPIHKVSPRATAFAAGVESASTARNSSSVLLTVKSPFVQEYFALPLLRASPPLLAFPCPCSSARICSTPLRISSYLCLSESSRIHAFALPRSAWLIYAFASLRNSAPSLSFSLPRIAVAMKCYAFALHSRAARICSTPLRCLAAHATPLRCLAAHTTPSLAFAFRHEALHCLCFAYRSKSDPSDLRLSTPLRCAFQLSLAFAPRCTAVTTCAPAEQTCQHNAVAELCAHIRAFAKLLQAIQRLCKSYHCRSRSNPIHAMPLLSR